MTYKVYFEDGWTVTIHAISLGAARAEAERERPGHQVVGVETVGLYGNEEAVRA